MPNEWLTAFSLAVAVLALVISSLHSTRNVRAVSNANQIQVIADVFGEVRSKEFRRNFEAVLSCPRDEDFESGFHSLPDPLRESAYAVCYFFEHIGVLVSKNLIPADTLLATMSSIMMRAWRALEPVIEAERRFRVRTYPPHISPTFLPHHECITSTW